MQQSEMHLSLSIQEIASINPSFLTSSINEEECRCHCDCRIVRFPSSRTRNVDDCGDSSEPTRTHHLLLVRNDTRSERWRVIQNNSTFGFHVHVSNPEEEIVEFILRQQGDANCFKERIIGTLIDLSSFLVGESKTCKWIDLKLNDELMAKAHISILRDDECSINIASSPTCHELGNKSAFDDARSLRILIRLNNVQIKGSHHWYHHEPFQIKYEFVGAIVQSREYDPLSSTTFEAKEDEFQMCIDHSEIQRFFNENKMQIYAYQEDLVLGEAVIDLNSMLTLQKEDISVGLDREVKRWVALYPPENRSEVDTTLEKGKKTSEEPENTILVELDLHILEGDDDVHYIRNAVEEGEKAYYNNPENFHQDIFRLYSSSNCQSATDLYRIKELVMEKANSLAKAEIELDKSKQKWEEFRILEERKFQDYLRKKEDALQNQLQQKALDQMRTIETCRNEYKSLEAKLKATLSVVEAKEREMERILAANNTTFIQKATELDLKHKLIQEETKHAIDMERAKNEAMLERIKGCEKVAEDSKRRAILAESEAEQLRTKFKSSNEAKATQELHMLRDRMVDMRKQLDREKEEKDKISSQRDEYRQAAHKLAKMIRKERERCSSLPSMTSKSCSKERQELHRIQNELHSLSAEE